MSGHVGSAGLKGLIFVHIGQIVHIIQILHSTEEVHWLFFPSDGGGLIHYSMPHPQIDLLIVYTESAPRSTNP